MDAPGKDDKRSGSERQPVSLVVDYDGAAELCRDYTENLSSGGVFVHTERELEVGDDVRLVLSFPGLLRPLTIDGIVRWARSVGNDGERGVGIEFIEFDGEIRERLEAVIERISKGSPDIAKQVLRVLLVEDNPHVARLIRDGLGSERLTGATFNFRVAENGRDGLELLLKEHFDVLVIDVYLPVMDGPTVIKRLRAEPRYKNLPVIAVSAGGPSARAEALAAGADFFLDKPMRLRQIIDSMRKLIGLADQ